MLEKRGKERKKEKGKKGFFVVVFFFWRRRQDWPMTAPDSQTGLAKLVSEGMGLWVFWHKRKNRAHLVSISRDIEYLCFV